MPIIIRPGTKDDLFGAFLVFQLALHGLYQSVGQASPEEKPNPEDLSPAFEYFQMFTEYFTETADQFWVVEEDGEIIGFSRSMLRDGIRQLSEFFVHPEKQAKGAGSACWKPRFHPTAHRIEWSLAHQMSVRWPAI